MYEVGFRAHMAARIKSWKHRAGLDQCYYHTNSTHISATCLTLTKAIDLSHAGSPPVASVVPRAVIYSLIPAIQHIAQVPRNPLSPGIPFPNSQSQRSSRLGCQHS